MTTMTERAEKLRGAAKVLVGRSHNFPSVVEITNGENLTTAYHMAGRGFFLDRTLSGGTLELRDGAVATRTIYDPALDLILAEWLAYCATYDAANDWANRTADLILTQEEQA